MIDRILHFSIQWRTLVVVLGLVLVGLGLYSATKLPIDAVPDVTSNQVQINTLAPAFAPEEMEKYVTFPIEVAMSSLPRKEEIRSISQFGLSQVTVTFEEGVDIYWARQLALERLLEAQGELPPGIEPELGPISTGLGEIFQFTVEKEGVGERESGRKGEWEDEGKGVLDSRSTTRSLSHSPTPPLRPHGPPHDPRLVHQAAASHRPGRD